MDGPNDRAEGTSAAPAGHGSGYRIVRRERCGPTTFLLEVLAPDVARACEPGHFVMIRIDETGERINKKIRNALTRKIPNVLVIGEREAEDGTVTHRQYGSERQETLALDVFKRRLIAAVRGRLRQFPESS